MIDYFDFDGFVEWVVQSGLAISGQRTSYETAVLMLRAQDRVVRVSVDHEEFRRSVEQAKSEILDPWQSLATSLWEALEEKAHLADSFFLAPVGGFQPDTSNRVVSEPVPPKREGGSFLR